MTTMINDTHKIMVTMKAQQQQQQQQQQREPHSQPQTDEYNRRKIPFLKQLSVPNHMTTTIMNHSGHRSAGKSNSSRRLRRHSLQYNSYNETTNNDTRITNSGLVGGDGDNGDNKGCDHSAMITNIDDVMIDTINFHDKDNDEISIEIDQMIAQLKEQRMAMTNTNRTTSMSSTQQQPQEPQVPNANRRTSLWHIKSKFHSSMTILNNTSSRSMNASAKNNSFRKGKMILSKVLSSSMDSVTKLVSVTSSPKKFSKHQRYNSMRASFSTHNAMSQNMMTPIEKSDDETALHDDDRISFENRMLLKKTATSATAMVDYTKECTEASNDNGEVVGVDQLYESQPLLLTKKSNRSCSATSSFNEFVQMDCFDPTQVIQIAAATTTTASDGVGVGISKKSTLNTKTDIDFRPIIDDDNDSPTDYKNINNVTGTNISPRALRKFRTVGISIESLESYEAPTKVKVESKMMPIPTIITVKDVPPSPRYSPTRIREGDGNNNRNSIPQERPIMKVTRVGSLRGGRKLHNQSSSSSSISLQNKSSYHSNKSTSPTTSNDSRRRSAVDTKMVLDRMSFGPGSKHHYRTSRVQQQQQKLVGGNDRKSRSQNDQSVLISNYQNLLLDINADNISNENLTSHSSFERLESKTSRKVRDIDFQLPKSIVERRKQPPHVVHLQQWGSVRKTKSSSRISSVVDSCSTNKINKRYSTTTPERERVQFDFDPKDVHDLCNAMEEAKMTAGTAASVHKSNKAAELPNTKTTIPLVPPYCYI